MTHLEEDERRDDEEDEEGELDREDEEHWDEDRHLEGARDEIEPRRDDIVEGGDVLRRGTLISRRSAKAVEGRRCGRRCGRWCGVWGNVRGYAEICEVWGDVGRCGEMWGDVGRCGEMWGEHTPFPSSP